MLEMKGHPTIVFRPDYYEGKDQRRRDQVRKQQNIAAKLQKYVDEAWEAGDGGVVTTYAIMQACDIDDFDKLVVDLLLIGVGGSSSGLTIDTRRKADPG